jgi:hypothetical protein
VSFLSNLSRKRLVIQRDSGREACE